MAEKLEQTVAEIRAKSLLLRQRTREVAEALAREKTAREASEKALAESLARSEALGSELTALKMTATLAPDRDGRARLKAMLAGLVRDIDRCISDLSR